MLPISFLQNLFHSLKTNFKYMKNCRYYSILFLVILMSALSSCSGWLDEEHETQITVDAIYSNPEALSKASVGLYYLHRRIVRDPGLNNSSEMFVGFLRGTDIEISRNGTTGSTAFGYYRPVELNTYRYHQRYWDIYYNIIGKANEIVFYGEKMGSVDPLALRAIGEARYFRALSLLTLFERYENIYLDTTPTTPENVNDVRKYRPATRQELFNQLTEDLDRAIELLNVSDNAFNSNKREVGRITQGAARHVRILVAMWMEDWDEAVRQGELMAASGQYDLVSLNDIFGRQKITHKELIASWQYAEALGGADYQGQWGYAGHRLKSICVPEYHGRNGGERVAENGGYGRAELFPNNYLLSLYDATKDQRYSSFYRHHYFYSNQKAAESDGRKVGDVIVPKGVIADDLKQLHVGLRKYDDFTSYPMNDSKGFSDVIQFRYAQTCILLSEAYLHKGDQVNALKWYNKTWERAGNPKRIASITMQDIMDEHARELALEGHRWSFLKRIGKLEEQIRLYAGEDGYNTEARTNFQPYNVNWPIPQTQLALFGDDYPQNEGYPR